ncbi:hypothetical protein ACFL3B_03945 [Gemmatimonadota bacterium]
MNSRFLTEFHSLCRHLDHRISLEALLDEYRRGNIADPDRTKEDAAIETHLADMTVVWDRLFPQFPAARWKRRTTMWEYNRGQRDEYLQQLLTTHIREEQSRSRLIVNPATVFGRHAMSLARELEDYEVVGTDIDVAPHRLYRLVSSLKYPRLSNYRFERENIFDPDLNRRPAAVTFFGACGVVTDGCIDYAIGIESPLLLCRSCCHECIGGNTDIVKRPSWMYWGFYGKNLSMKWIERRFAGTGYYFSDRHRAEAYPRSRAAREIMDSDTMIDVARNSVESDICRSIIDLDRCLFLQENGYDVLYREELFFAHKRA